jgi:HNH endonuclease.
MSEDNLSSKYFEGTPCQKCGSTKRYVSKKCCVNCNNKQGLKWQQANPERVRGTNQKWNQANREKNRERCRKWNQANPEKKQECDRKYRQENPKKKYEQNRKWFDANQEKMRESKQKWKQANPEQYKIILQVSGRKNKAKRMQAEGSYTAQEWIDLKEKYDNRCLCCRRHQSELDRVLEQDHIIPLTKGGTNWISNIQPLCRDCNGMGGKGTKIIDYRQQHSISIVVLADAS